MTFEEWRDFLKQLGSIADMPYSAIKEPCPKCGNHKGYSVTNDGYAYCESCHWGTATEYPFTSLPLEIRNPDGSINHDKTDWLYK